MSNDKTWDDDKKFAFKAWKYYGSIGGADKNWMIQIVTWLLGFSAAIIGFYASGKLTEPFGNVLLIVIGILVSIAAVFVALLYGGYAARNWSIADRIACKYEWTEQKPDFDPFKDIKEDTKEDTKPRRWKAVFTAVFTLGLTKSSLHLARPCRNRVAPVFWIFFWISIWSFAVHVILLLELCGVFASNGCDCSSGGGV